MPPEYVDALGATEFFLAESFVEKFRRQATADELQQVCLAQCDVCVEIYKGILALTALDIHLPAQALCRNVFEVVITTTYVVKHPETLRDFLDFGKLVRLRSLRSVKTFVNDYYQEQFKKHVAATQKEFESLDKRFGSKWLNKMVDTLKYSRRICVRSNLAGMV